MMRQINIDLANLLPSYPIGYIGEVNASKLCIDISSMKEETSEASLYILKFQDFFGNTYASKVYNDIPDNTISCNVWKELTAKEHLKMVVEGYAVEEEQTILLQKSPTVNLTLENSITGEAVIIQDSEVDSLVAYLNRITTDMSNKYTDVVERADAMEQTKQSVDIVVAEAKAGNFNGRDGLDGLSPLITVAETGSPKIYALNIVDAEGTTTTPNLLGMNGTMFFETFPDDSKVVTLSEIMDAYKEKISNSPDQKAYCVCRTAGHYSFDTFDADCDESEILSLHSDYNDDSDEYDLAVQSTGWKLNGDKGDADYNNLTNQPIKNLALSMTQYTMFTDIADGCYIVVEQGIIKTTSGKLLNFAVGTELMIGTYNGVKSGTYQTAKSVATFNDEMTTNDKSFTWLNTSHKDLQITENATDSTIPTSKAVYDFVNNQISNAIANVDTTITDIENLIGEVVDYE